VGGLPFLPWQLTTWEKKPWIGHPLEGLLVLSPSARFSSLTVAVVGCGVFCALWDVSRSPDLHVLNSTPAYSSTRALTGKISPR